MQSSLIRTRWAAIGAAVAVSLGAGGIGITQATTSSGERSIYVPIEPCRLADTRPAPDTVGPRTVPLGAAEIYTLSGWGTVGDCTLRNGTTGLSLNVTGLDATVWTFLTVFPADSATVPLASHLNLLPGQPPTPNAVNVDLDTTGEFSIYNFEGTANIIIDVVGYYDHHNHDDVYMTEAEIKQTTMFAVVNKDGTLRRGTSGTRSAPFAGGGFVGDYTVTFPRSVVECGWAVSPTGIADGKNPYRGEFGVNVEIGKTHDLYVQANDSSGTPAEAPFSVIVTCP